MLYRLLKLIIRLGMRLYYSEIKVKNAHLLDESGPTIIIANHPNTLVDAWLIGNLCKQPIYYMTKGTFFSSPLKMWFLRSLKLIPINRATENRTKGVSNDETFAECYKLLEEGKTLVVFPEGNSFMERKLRDLKSGTARIALEVEKRNHGKIGIKVIPMGLIYLQANKFRSSVLVNVGNPIGVTEYVEEYKESQITAAKKLTSKFRTALESVLITTQSKDQEDLIEDLTQALQSKYRGAGNGVEKEIDLLKQVRDRVEEISLIEPWKVEEIQHLMMNINWRLAKLKIRADFLDRRFRSTMFVRQIISSIVFLIIGFPLFIVGVIHNIIPYKLTEYLLPKLVKHVEYYAPVAILLGLLLYPLNYIGFVVLMNQFVELSFWQEFLYFITMPVLGMYAYYFMNYLAHISYKWNYIFLIMNQRGAIVELQQLRQRLFKMVFED